MRMMFDSTYTNFLDMYSPVITFIDEARICEDTLAVDYFLEETELTLSEVKEIMHLKANKNHISIPPGTKAKVVSMKSGGEKLTLLEINGIQFTCYMTKIADFCMVEVEPLNPEFESIFSSVNIPKKQDNKTLYGINIAYLVNAVDSVYGMNNKTHAYEELKHITKDEAISCYEQWKVREKMFTEE